MRLRYLHIRNYPPLQDLDIIFNADSPLKTPYAIHFVVGVNGSGKTHLLQALLEIFICLGQKRKPSFPVTLIYELGKGEQRQTFIFDNPLSGNRVGWWHSHSGFALPLDAQREHFQNILQFVRQSPNTGWKAIIDENGGWSGLGDTLGLPKAVLAYTTGFTKSWEQLFKQINHDWEDQTLENTEPPLERPLGWNTFLEENYQNSTTMVLDGGRIDRVYRADYFNQQAQERICQLVTPLMLKLAVLAVTLEQAFKDLAEFNTYDKKQLLIQQINQQQRPKGLPLLLAQVAWVYPLTLIISFKFEPTLLNATVNKSGFEYLKQLAALASEITQEPEPSRQRKLIIDLTNHKELGKLKAFLKLAESPFASFQRLLELHHLGLLDDIQIGVRKTNPDDILLFDELSDGEQMFLGRMSLFHLLQKQDDVLLLLDEPETHFNDRWKRELVDMIDQVLDEETNHLLISTHSGITLTDVFTNEITLIEKNPQGEAQQRFLPSIHTFGATSDHPLRDVFGAMDTVGKRAASLLDILLLFEPNKNLIEQIWQAPTEAKGALEAEFIAAVQEVYADKDYQPKRIQEVLNTLTAIAHDKRYVAHTSVVSLIKYFADSVGPGYYQLDLYRAVYRLTGGTMDVT